MGKRADGIETRNRILEAACEVFAEHGFREATIAAICERAGTNSASVNYHFRDKESLYIEVWRFTAQRAKELYPVGGGVAAEAPACERLRGHVGAILRRMTDVGQLGYFHRLRMMEMANPTGLIDPIREEMHQPYREHMQRVLGDLLGSGARRDELERCEMSIIGQCRAARRWRSDGGARRTALSEREVREMTDHIVRFSLAGVHAVRRRVAHGGKAVTAS